MFHMYSQIAVQSRVRALTALLLFETIAMTSAVPLPCDALLFRSCLRLVPHLGHLKNRATVRAVATLA